MNTLLNFSLYLLLFAGLMGCKKKEGLEPQVALRADTYYPNSGKGGTLVTIEGEGFTGNPEAVEVTFGGTPAVLVNVETDVIVARAPENGETGILNLSVNGTALELGTYSYQSLSVQQVFPTNGPAGSQIQIRGEGFSSTVSPASVTINENEALVVSASDTLLVAEVPDAAGSGKVAVRVDGMDAEGQHFTYQAIELIKPLTGGAGTRVVLSGEGFAEELVGNTVDFNGAEAIVEEASGDQLVVIAPEGVETGPLSVTINGQKTTGPVFTVVPPPSIAMVSPLSGPAGTEMTISGTQFSTEVDENKVLINGTEVALQSATETELKLTLPGGTGSGMVEVIVNDQAVEGPEFRDQTLGILTVSPESGLAGTEVTISGMGFSAHTAENTVTFNGVAAQILQASESSLTVVAPNDLTSGNVTVRVGGMEAVSPARFRRAGMETLIGGPNSSDLSTAVYAIACNSAGEVFFADNGDKTLKKVGVDGQVSVVSFINGGTLADPYGLAIDGQDNLYITDGADLKVMTPNGNLSVAASLPVSTISMGIVSISPDGQRIIALGRGFSDPYLFTPDSFVGTVSLGSSQYTNTRPAIDTDRTIYYTNNYSSGRSINRLLDGADFPESNWVGRLSGHTDGVGMVARFQSVSCMVWGGADLLYVGDEYKVRTVNTQAAEAGTHFSGSRGYADGGLEQAQLMGVNDIAPAPDGSLYILDRGNRAIRKLFLE